MGKKPEKAIKNEKKGKQEKKEKKQKAKEKSPKKLQKAKTATTKNHEITMEKRAEMIATAAYYIAERHGFNPERADQDWREAELQIDAAIGGA